MHDLLRVFALSLAMMTLPAWSTENKGAISKAETALLGEHPFSLHWVSWDELGKAEIRRGRKDELRLEARQEVAGNYVDAEGVIKIVSEREFTLTGKIVTRVAHFYEQPCVREGEFHFKASGARKYWRLQEMENPCRDGVDYVDIFF